MTDSSFQSAPMIRCEQGQTPIEGFDDLAREEPLEIRVRGRAISVTMRTPGHDDELAAGFLWTEGVIRSRADIAHIEPSGRHAEGNVINVFLTAGVEVDFERLTRHVFASSSCGLCGKATIEAVQCQFPPVTSHLKVTAELLQGLPEKLRASQQTFDRTGGLHAAGLFDERGELRVAREDVGRHNAVDKVLGHALLAGWAPLDRSILMVSGRTSFEIMQKALAAGVPIIAAVSAPSSLAAEFAHANGQTLIGFLRPGRMNIYTHRQRVTFPSTAVNG
jgi:FdhD protein